MCIFKDKWTEFIPTAEYLSEVKNLTTVDKLATYIKKIKYISDKKDYWQTPVETFIRGKGDCEDFARLALDILVHIQKRKNVRFIIYIGTEKGQCHAVCVFPYYGKYNVFSNDKYYTHKDNYIDVGHIFYPKLKYMEVRNSEGKVISRKYRLWGNF